jgi:cobalt/nickel transport system permease protein
MTRSLALDTAAWSSPWRHRSVADKAVLTLALLATTLLLPVWPAAALSAAAALVVLLGPARLAPTILARSLRSPLLFIVLGAASVLVSVSWHDGPRVAITAQTSTQALTVLGRGVAGTLCVFVLAATTPMVDLLAGLRRARVPEACVEVASLVYRLLFVLLDTTRRIREAQAARLGLRDRRTTLRSASALSGTLLVRAWDRARRLEEGLAGRGYTGALPSLDPPGRVSLGFLCATAALVGVIVVVSLLGAGTR